MDGRLPRITGQGGLPPARQEPAGNGLGADPNEGTRT